MCACLGLHVQVVSGDSWASAITRSLYPPDETDHAVAFFFVSYVLIGGTVLINIVMTVLLDEFLKAVALEKEKAEEELEAEQEACRIAGVLDPLIESMSHFTDNNDLTQKIATTFTIIDEVRRLCAKGLARLFLEMCRMCLLCADLSSNRRGAYRLCERHASAGAGETWHALHVRLVERQVECWKE